MITIALCAGSFIACLMAGNRSLRAGLLTIIGIGYVYGILRANLPDTWTYLMFDAGVIALFLTQLRRPIPLHDRGRLHDLKLWLTVLVGWPVVLFFLFADSNILVDLVGLRGNVFLLPFLLLGARLESDDLLWLAERIAFFNIAVVGVGIVQFFVGIEPFFPDNQVTEIIYKSRDVLDRSAHRIPSTFSSAHAFSGTLVITLPLLLGGWSAVRDRWRTHLFSAAVLVSLVGVFIAAARLHVVTAACIVLVVTVFGRFGRRQQLKWLMVLGVVGYVVAGNARLQRFTSLSDSEYVGARVSGSVNDTVFDLIRAYPLGNGLAGGGTSIPYFLRQGIQEPIGLENEYARIALEQGIPGLIVWMFFVFWILTRRPWRVDDEWRLGRLAGWVACVVSFASGTLGTGMLTSVPHTALLLLLTGWVATARRAPARGVQFTRVPARTAPRRLGRVVAREATQLQR